MQTQNWYQELIKPEWAPEPWVFGFVWSFLYFIIFISFGFVFYKYFSGAKISNINIKNQIIPFIVILPFILNLFFNFIFTPIQFGLRNNLLGSLDIFLVLATIVWFMAAIWKYFPLVAIVNIPYLIWVCIATVLQISITYLNWK
jgi:tryptophan-rich sensory protein